MTQATAQRMRGTIGALQIAIIVLVIITALVHLQRGIGMSFGGPPGGGQGGPPPGGQAGPPTAIGWAPPWPVSRSCSTSGVVRAMLPPVVELALGTFAWALYAESVRSASAPVGQGSGGTRAQDDKTDDYARRQLM
jgi:hypothetical protein